MDKPIVLAMTGASGAIYAARLLQALISTGREVHLVISKAGTAVCKQELGVAFSQEENNVAEFLSAADEFLNRDAASNSQRTNSPQLWERLRFHRPDDYFTPIASGSFLTGGMVICPCSGSTLSGIARSASDNLIARAAEVHLKERRKLIVVPRETPLSTFQLENMHRLSLAGVVVLPAAPGWYHGVKGMEDLVDFVVARILDQLAISNDHMQRWASS